MYEVYVYTADGIRLALLPKLENLDYTKTYSDQATCGFDMPYSTEYIQSDRLVEILRDGKREFLGPIRVITSKVGSKGKKYLQVGGLSTTSILSRRIVAYDAETAQASKTGNADNVMKAIVRENLGSSAVAGRDLTGYGFSVEPDTSLGPSIAIEFSRRNVLSVLMDIANRARKAGNEVFFAVEPDGIDDWVFRTFVGQPGKDLTGVLRFGVKYGNVIESTLLEDWSREANYIYAGGQGLASEREIREAGDNARAGRSWLSRTEKFVNASMESTGAAVQDAADRSLEENRPLIRFTADLVDSDQTKYRRDWNLGDKVRVEHLGKSYDALIRTVRVRVDGVGRDTVTASLEVEL